MRAPNLLSRDLCRPAQGCLSLKEFAAKLGISPVTMFRRLRDGCASGAVQDIVTKVWSIPPDAVVVVRFRMSKSIKVKSVKPRKAQPVAPLVVSKKPACVSSFDSMANPWLSLVTNREQAVTK